MIASTLSAPNSAQLAAACGLQKLLTELVVLSLDAKQAHWNMTGPAVLHLHALTDNIAEDTRGWADRAAERAVALGFYVDARPATVAAAASTFPLGRVTDIEAIAELVELIGTVTATAGRVLNQLALADAVGCDISPSTSSKDWRSTGGCLPPRRADSTSPPSRPSNGSRTGPTARAMRHRHQPHGCHTDRPARAECAATRSGAASTVHRAATSAHATPRERALAAGRGGSAPRDRVGNHVARRDVGRRGRLPRLTRRL